ncbi:tripartite tricarboxylate transporter TctB family protein [Sedimentitalea sp.]|uniref:tripartite tricarboxylate transporter TctB family protein n=1 Tax=Sedimentitalea sp. TaxID=2048915 RepID=UPI0032985808
MNDSQTERGFCLSVLAVSALFFAEARNLPTNAFDAFGSGKAPMLVSCILIVLSIAVLIRPLFAGLEFKATSAFDKPSPSSEVIVRSVIFVLLALVYVTILSTRWVHFVPLTSVFLVAGSAALNPFSRQTALVNAATAIVVPIGVFLAFTRFFIVDLPGAY